MKICVDLDGTICENISPGVSYKDVLPLPGAVDTLEELKQRGYYIVISVNTAFTAGQMVTKLETQHHSWADNDSRLSTTEMLQETGIYQTAVRNVETGNTTNLKELYK